MADILKITTPLINRNQELAPKPALDPTSPFQLTDINKVVKPFNQKDILPQNNTYLKESGSPEILLDLLKDPGVTVTYLKNIFMLEEIFKLLPHNNAALTKEIESLYHELLMPHHEIADELMRQEQDATVFRGEFFDFLRKIVNESKPGSDVQHAVVNLMRSINNLMVKDDVLDAVANSLTYLAKNLQPSKDLAQKIGMLIFRFRMENAAENFSALKDDALAILKEVEESVLFDPRLQKMASITIYNLSRYNDSMEYFHDAAGGLWQRLAGADRVMFAGYINSLMAFFKAHLSGAGKGEGAEAEEAARSGTAAQGGEAGAAAQAETAASAASAAMAGQNDSSKVMDALIAMIQMQSAAEEAGRGEAGQVDKIIHSLLSSPCNFTPLLHFVVPAWLGDVKAFAEMWVNPYDDDGGGQGSGAGRRVHILIVLDVEMLGRFEVELKVRNTIIDLSLYCPSGLENSFSDMLAELPFKLRGLDTPFRLGRVEIETMDRDRSLMEVFKTLPYKRMGLDVRV